MSEKAYLSGRRISFAIQLKTNAFLATSGRTISGHLEALSKTGFCRGGWTELRQEQVAENQRFSVREFLVTTFYTIPNLPHIYTRKFSTSGDSKRWYDFDTVQAGTPMTVKEMRPAMVTWRAFPLGLKLFKIGAMTTAETNTYPPPLLAKPPAARRSPRPPWVEAILTDWRKEWPAVFTKPVPLAVGISGQIKAAARANDKTYDRKAFSMSIHLWTIQSAYLRALARGETRRNLDGSEAGVPDETARQEAQKLLDERAERQAEKARQKKETVADVPSS